MHAVNILGAGLDAYEDHLLSAIGPQFGSVGIEHDLPARRTGRRGQASGQHIARRFGIERRVEQLVERHRVDAQDRGLLVDQPFAHHVDRHLERGLRSPLAVARLQQPQRALLHGELDILHVGVMLLEQFEHARQLGKGVGHGFFHARLVRARLFAPRLGQVLRRADTRDHVLALRIDQPFAVIGFLAGRGIAREGNAGGAGVAHIAEHHRLHIDRSAHVMRDVVQPAVDLGALGVPAVEHRADRAPELLDGVLRKRLAQFTLDDRLVFRDQPLPFLGAQLGVSVVTIVFLGDLERFLEQPVIDAQHDIAIHLDEAAVAVPGEARIARSVGEALHRLVIETEVEDSVHHPGHRDRCARAHRDQQRIGGIAEVLAHGLLDMVQRRRDIAAQLLREVRPTREIFKAFLGRDGETRGNRQADARHFGEVRPLAAGNSLVLLPCIRMRSVAAEGEDRFVHCNL